MWVMSLFRLKGGLSSNLPLLYLSIPSKSRPLIRLLDGPSLHFPPVENFGTPPRATGHESGWFVRSLYHGTLYWSRGRRATCSLSQCQRPGYVLLKVGSSEAGAAIFRHYPKKEVHLHRKSFREGHPDDATPNSASSVNALLLNSSRVPLPCSFRWRKLKFDAAEVPPRFRQSTSSAAVQQLYVRVIPLVQRPLPRRIDSVASRTIHISMLKVSAGTAGRLSALVLILRTYAGLANSSCSVCTQPVSHSNELK